MNMTITSASGIRTVAIEPGMPLSDILHREDPSFAMPCAGNHTCGKCRVQVEGAVTPMDESERRLLSGEDQANGIRLACFCRVCGDVSVRLNDAGASKIIAWNKTAAFEHTETGFGIAVDIGTTTVAMQLFERASGRVLAERLAENRQRGYGADVISRIEACKTSGLDTLSDLIADQLEEMAAACLAEAGLDTIDEAVVTGNSTMLHLYEGLDPASLAVVPFDVQSYFGCMSRRTLAGAPVYLPRCIGAYVGADIICAILASGMVHKGGVELLADIGTNGEMALLHNGKLLCCSTAAGPAFEGAGLSQGMPAAPGAIRAVQQTDGAITYKTVQDKPAIGVCGSGILDALRVMLETKIIDDSGYLDEDYEIDGSGVTIIQKDVRQIQLAKSAICAGVITLLEEEGIDAADVAQFCIAGGFGSSMDYTSACAIGLFPAALRDKTEFIGNGALGGAAMLLMNRSLREYSESLAENATELSLSASAAFMDYYVDCMSFMEF